MPPKIKIYEALGAIADRRVETLDKGAKIYSSSRNKFYEVAYDSQKKAIMANDNGSYWQGYLGYPSIAFLLQSKVISFDPSHSEALKDIPWKDINTKLKNDFEETIIYVHDKLRKNGLNVNKFSAEVDRIYNEIEKLNLSLLGRKVKPPEGY